jgi:hypothetical protein
MCLPVRRSLRDYWDGGGNGVAGFEDDDEDDLSDEARGLYYRLLKSASSRGRGKARSTTKRWVKSEERRRRAIR